jgi:hypothetical protein
VRAPVADIAAPPFPPRLPWVNVASLRMDRQIGRPVLIEFWDFCRVNSLRTLPYMRAWHERYADDGLRVIGVHCGGYPPSRDEHEVRSAVERLEIEYPVPIDSDFELWGRYDNAGWPARYLFDAGGMLFDYHYGEGGYRDTERAIQELLRCEREPVAPIRPEDAPGAALAVPSPERPGAWSGEYEAGGVWAVLEGRGQVRANRRPVAVRHPGCFALLEHERHRRGRLELELGAGVTCHAVCFTAGLAQAPQPAVSGAGPGA